MLNLSSNSLSGTIPSKIGNLVKLRYFFINGNMLSGDIPISLTNLTGIYRRFFKIGYNALYSDNAVLVIFLKNNTPGWRTTQTIAPTNISASLVKPTSLRISWKPILYTDDPGGYEVHFGTAPGGPYTLYGTTANKSVSAMRVDGLVPGATYYFALKTVTYPHTYNQNTVTSEFSSEYGYTVPSITINSPNGGEYWAPNTTHKIEWSAIGLSQSIHIALEQDGVKVALIARNIDPAPGNYSWKVGDCLQGTIVPGTGYKILLKENNSVTGDRSDNFFSLLKPYINVEVPNGGEKWRLHSTQNITWIAPGVEGKVNISLWKDGVLLGLIAYNVAAAAGSYAWTVSAQGNYAVPAGKGYKIKIRGMGMPASDTSDASFTLTN